MPSKKGRYYLSRVVKHGELNQSSLCHAIRQSVRVKIGDNFWSITDVLTSDESEVPDWIFGKLTKYNGEEVDVVRGNKTKQEFIEDMKLASSPFVYVPRYSGISYMHVWNGIKDEDFRNNFSRVIEEKYQRFMVGCEINNITDIRTFSQRIKSLEKITEISAKVNPPNPLFGPQWAPLKEYLGSRNLEEARITETSQKGIRTQIQDAVAKPVSVTSEAKIPETFPPLALCDAAILMAADGYGSGHVSGDIGKVSESVHTSDARRSFLHAKEPVGSELAEYVTSALESINRERDLRH